MIPDNFRLDGKKALVIGSSRGLGAAIAVALAQAGADGGSISLLSRQRYIHGHILAVDGGWLAR